VALIIGGPEHRRSLVLQLVELDEEIRSSGAGLIDVIFVDEFRRHMGRHLLSHRIDSHVQRSFDLVAFAAFPMS
jgi:hypothetical protein